MPITPPVGLNLIMIQRLTGDEISRVAGAAFPFFLILISMTMLLALFPEVATWPTAQISARG